MKITFITLLFALAGCSVNYGKFQPVENFDKARYLGTWYSIARLDHRFERGLHFVTADYSLREDGGIAVRNCGYHIEDQEWEVAEGKAYFAGDETVAQLKVSFFGFFYGAYTVVDLAEDYSYAMVASNDTDYLWFLSRTPELPAHVLMALQEKAKNLGFDVSKIIYLDQQQGRCQEFTPQL